MDTNKQNTVKPAKTPPTTTTETTTANPEESLLSSSTLKEPLFWGAVVACLLAVVIIIWAVRTGKLKGLLTARTRQSNRANVVPAVIDDSPSTIRVDALARSSARLNWSYVPGNAQHIGAREEQQDSFGLSNLSDSRWTDAIGAVAVLADGMGGMAGGREASNAAVDVFLRIIEQATIEQSTFGMTGSGDEQPAFKLTPALIESMLQTAIVHAHDAVLDVNTQLAAQGLESETGAGTTICAAWLHDSTLFWISVGDSRIYYVQNGTAPTQLTVDDNYGMVLDEQARQGLISAEEAYNSNERHMLTAYLGSPEFDSSSLQVYSIPVQPGDRVLLCSDGIYGSVTEDELNQAVRLTPQTATDELLQMALNKNKRFQDNLTAVMIGMEVIE